MSPNDEPLGVTEVTENNQEDQQHLEENNNNNNMNDESELNNSNHDHHNKQKHWSLEQFFTNQLTIDNLQTDYMLEYYTNCYKIHLEKKLQRKGLTYSPSYDQDDFETLISAIDTYTTSQSDFPRDESTDESLRIGEEGWLILSHWAQALFKKQIPGTSNTCLEPSCEMCLKDENIRKAFEEFKNERISLFEGTCHTPLNVFEKFVDLWNQNKYLQSTRYELSDHACATIFASGILNCRLTHFVFGRDLQGENPYEPHQCVCILNALEQNTSIFSIDLSGLIIIHDSVAKAIASMIRKKKSLKRMVISKLSLSKSIYNTLIIDAIAESSLTQLEIYIYDGKLKSNFRFLEHSSRSDLKKLASKPFKSFMFTSYNFTFPIDYCYLFEELLKNKSNEYLHFNIDDIDGIVRSEDDPINEYQQFTDKLYSVIEKTEEFHFKDYYLLASTPQQEYHIVKHAKKLTSYAPYLKFLQVANNSDEDVSLSNIGFLRVKNFINIGFSRIVPFFNRVVKATLKMTKMNDEQFETFSNAILNAPLLEKLTLLRVDKLQEKNSFSKFFKVKNTSQLRKIILSDFGVDNHLMVIDAFSTFLDLEYFPKLTAFYLSGRETELKFECIEALVDCIKKQEPFYPKGLRKLELLEDSIKDSQSTEHLLKSLTSNRIIETLGIWKAPLKNVNVLVDFIINNKSLTEIKLNYSECETIPEDLLCKEDEMSEMFLNVFGAFQINWNLVAIDWYCEYYWNTFEFGTVNHVGERFLVERIMERNKSQKHINSLMQPILSQFDKFSQLSDVNIISISSEH